MSPCTDGKGQSWDLWFAFKNNAEIFHFFFIYFFSLMAEKQQQFSKSLNHPDTECKVHVCLFL